MDHSVKLAKLPDGLKFPERLGERIQFDAAGGRLSFRGFMTKCTYDVLSALCDDVEYHRALEQLFVLTSEEVMPRAAGRGLPTAILLATVTTIVLALAVAWSLTRSASAAKRRGPSTHDAAATSRQ